MRGASVFRCGRIDFAEAEKQVADVRRRDVTHSAFPLVRDAAFAYASMNGAGGRRPQKPNTESTMPVGAGHPAVATLGRRDTVGAALLLLALALAYYVGVHIGFAFTLDENAVSLLWPTNAILLAALLVCPPR